MQHEQNDRPFERAVARRTPALACLALLALAGIIGGYFLLRLATNGQAHERPDDPPGSISSEHSGNQQQQLFVGWGKPDLAIVVSGQMHGYMFPCGCSSPQNGGLVRRLTLIDDLKAAEWPVVGVDLGELIAPTGIHRQRELKLKYTMKALDVLGYRAVGLGKYEMAMPLVDALAQHSIDFPRPRPVASTLGETEKKGEHYYDLNVRPYEIFGVAPKDAPPRVGVVSLTGPGLEDWFVNDKSMKFRNNSAVVLPKIFDAFTKEKVDIAMLLHHEYPKYDPDKPKVVIDENDPKKFIKRDKARRNMAEACARAWEAAREKNPAIPQLHLMMILTEEPEPPGVMQLVKGTPTHIIEIGHKGKYIGVVGIFNKGGQISLKYELVKMDPSFAPKAGQKNAVVDVLEEYSRQVRDEEVPLLAAYNKLLRSAHPIQMDEYVQKKYGGSHYIGSEECMKCHAQEVAIWTKTKHATAFQSLENATNPKLRQFDPECIVCHTVGFKNHEGYNQLPFETINDLQQSNAPPAAVQAKLQKHNAELKNVGCESCHGPASAHAENRKDERLYPLINPYRPSDAEKKAVGAAAKRLFDARMSRLDDFCTKCHDEENDVHWKSVLPKWVGGGIVHNRPGNVGNQWLPAAPPGAQAGNGKQE